MKEGKRARAVMVGLNFGVKLLRWAFVRGNAAEHIELVGICDLDADLALKAAKEFDVSVYEDLDSVLEDDSVQLVILMTGPNGRAELIRRIIRADKDVMTTKPFETEVEAAGRILAEARELGRFVYMNSPAISRSRDLEIIAEWREKYDLGMPVSAHFECWYKLVERADGTWYDDPDRCFAAPLLRLGVYGINDFLQIFGEPEAVQVMETRLFTGRPTSDLARMNLRFKSGALTHLVAGWTQSPERAESSIALHFERGTIYRNPPMYPGDGIRWHGLGSTYMGVTTEECRDGMPIETMRIGNDQISREYQWDVLNKCIQSRRRPANETSDKVIVDSVRVLEAMRKASRSGTVEAV